MSKKTVKTSGPSKIKKTSPEKDHDDMSEPNESSRLIPEEDDDFEIQLDDDIKDFDDLDDLDDDDDDDY